MKKIFESLSEFMENYDYSQVNEGVYTTDADPLIISEAKPKDVQIVKDALQHTLENNLLKIPGQQELAMTLSQIIDKYPCFTVKPNNVAIANIKKYSNYKGSLIDFTLNLKDSKDQNDMNSFRIFTNTSDGFNVTMGVNRTQAVVRYTFKSGSYDFGFIFMDPARLTKFIEKSKVLKSYRK